MKTSILAAASFLAFLSLPALADTTTKFSGTATCAKCELKKTDACQMAIKTKNTDGKEETLMVENNKISQDFHNKICKEAKDVNAEGTITEKDGQKVVTLKKITLAK